MLEYPLIIFSIGLILLYGIISQLSERSVISAPMVFVSMGFLASLFSYETLHSGIHAPWVKIVAEITLVMVLFGDASTLDMKELIKEKKLPLRLLFIGLPITMFLGILIGLPFFPNENIWLIALMALILSPTDAALGLAVVKSKLVPLKIRQAINVESGLNDGIALPPVLLCLAVLAGSTDKTVGSGYWLIFITKQFIFGPIIGAIIGRYGGRLIEKVSSLGWITSTFQRLSAPSLALLAFTFAEYLHGNGFIAAFFAGMFLDIKDKKIHMRLHSFNEAGSQALILFVFLLFGLIMVPMALPFWDLKAFIYALLSLTLIRMFPVWLSLLGTKLNLKSVAFIAWFGPRGIASVLYTLLAVVEIGIEGHQRIFSVIILTVLMSVFLHGITALPFTKLFINNKQL